MQNGITTSIKPQQVTFIVPGAENFEPTEISEFVQKAHDNLVGCLLLFNWIFLLHDNETQYTVLYSFLG